MHFLAVSELLSDSLTAIYVELHRCPLHHSILLTQGRIWEIFAKKFWELAILKNELFLSRPFWIFFLKKIFFFASFPWKLAQIYMVEWMGQNFDVFPGLQKFPCYAQYCVIQCTYENGQRCSHLDYHDLKRVVFYLLWNIRYHKIASSNTSRLEAHIGFFRLLMKGIFGPMYCDLLAKS